MSESRVTKNRALLLYLIAAAGLLILPQLAQWLQPLYSTLNTQWILLILNVLYYVPFIALPCFFGLRGTALRNSPVRVWDMVVPALCAAVGVYLVNDLTVIWAIPLEAIGLNVNTASPVPQNTRELALAMLGQAVIPAVCEEFLIRGAVLTAFERKGTKRAVILSAALFALLHGSIVGLPGEFLMGLVIGTAAVATDSLWIGVTVHTYYNASLILLQYKQRNLPSPAGDTLLAQAGGTTGVLILAAEALIMGGVIFVLMRGFVRVRRHRNMRVVRPREGAVLKRNEIPAAVLCGIAVILLYIVNTLSML